MQFIDLDSIEVEDVRKGPVPRGTYQCEVAQCIRKDTKAGGQMIEVTYRIVAGEYKNSRIWDCHNVDHSNPEVVKIGLQGLKKLAMAVGVSGKLASPSELAVPGKAVNVTVEVRNDPSYGESNVVSRVLGCVLQEKTEPAAQDVSDAVAPF
jgi:hypothetical protein